MLRKFSMALMGLSMALFTNAQVAMLDSNSGAAQKTDDAAAEPKPTFSITGSADVYYKFDFAKTKANNFTSFTNSQNSFSLGMASVKLENKTDKVDMVLDLGFGTRASEFTYTDNGMLQAVKQLYVSYSPADWIKFTAGSWATHVGYELLDPQLNRNYSMSYLFTNGPFSHTGFKADITKGNHGFMLGISNATDYRIMPDGQINKKFLLAQYSLAVTDDVNLYVNYVSGKSPDTSKSEQVDAVLTAKISDKFNIGVNGTIASTKAWDGAKNLSGKSWGGGALYLNVDPNSWFGLTARAEYFSDNNQLKVFSAAPMGGNIFATTLSANFKVNALTIIPEFRIDNASENIFTGKSGAAKSSAANFLVAAVYSF
jgi:hypothetical protein